MLGLSIETLLISRCLKIMAILITVILYGRMIEIYCTVSIAPTQAWIDTQHRVSWTAPQGGSSSFIQLDIPEDDEEFCKRLLAERGVLLVPGSRFELPCGARLGYCASEDVLREGLRLLGEALAEFDR